MKFFTYEELTQAEITNRWGRHSMTVSVYFIDGMMIDTGPFKKQGDIIQLMGEWSPSQVVLTHHHEDHTGNAFYMQERGIPVYSHVKGVSLCKDEMKLPLYRRVFWGERPSFHPQPLARFHKSEKLQWEVIHTPGHAEDHIALFNKEKGWVIGGDLYVQPHPKSAFSFESIPEMATSLRKLLSYDFDVYICSHVGVIQNGRKAIQRKLDYLETMMAEILDNQKLGMSAKEIHKKMFPNRHPMHLLSFFENSPRHFINSVLNQ